jgi:ribosomal protein S12 methylthiotransferase accessory factor
MTTVLPDEPFTPVARALERLEEAVTPLVGIVARTMSTTYTTDEASLPNCAAQLASAVRTLGGRAMEYGSGAHPLPARARAAAIGEALERYSALYVPRERVQLATARSLGDAAVRPSRFALFHAAQHAEGDLPFTEFTGDTPTAFVEGASLQDGSPAYLPAELVYLGRPATASLPIAYSTSNGLACAATFTEAVLRALLELVERDAVMLAWKCGLSLPLLDWSDDDDLLSYERRFFGRTGVPFNVLDGSVFLEVPIAIAVVHGRPGSGASLAMGAGACATVADAWLAAVSEGFGVYRWVRQQTLAQEHGTPPPEPDRIETFEEHLLYYARPEHAQLAGFLDGSGERRATSSVGALEGATPRSQVEAVLRRLARRGLSAYVVDVTSPDVRSLGLSVARVIVPELCALDVSHRARFLGGTRLYTAAHEAGLVPAPLDLADLNPLPHPFP